MRTDSEHEHSTRVAHHRHQNSARTAAVLVAVLFSIGPAAHFAHPANVRSAELSGPATDVPFDGSNVAHEIAIEMVTPGNEGLKLSAKLVEDGGVIDRPISWKIATSEGEQIFSGDVPVADIRVPPGDYAVDIHYGAAHFARGLTLLEGNRLSVSFVLNVGGIRILPRVQGIGLPASPSHSRVYALSGLRKGELITQSEIPGEILRVPAGDYRVESRFDAGNAVAVADVKVKPGIMSAVEIDHAAGLARLAFVGAPSADVAWNVADDKGEALASFEGLSADIVLKPGTYTASASAGGEVLTAKFDIGAGESRDIILGN